MFFFDIQHWFAKAAGWCGARAMDAYGSWLALDWLGDLLNDLSTAFAKISGFFYDAGFWAQDITIQVSQFIDTIDLSAIITGISNDVAALWQHITDLPGTISSAIEDWWELSKPDIEKWVNTLISPLSTAIEQIEDSVDKATSAWDNFWTLIYPNLVDFSSLKLLLDTKVTELEPFWEGWQDMKENVVTFFTDPWEWFYDRLEDFFDRFW